MYPEFIDYSLLLYWWGSFRGVSGSGRHPGVGHAGAGEGGRLVQRGGILY